MLVEFALVALVVVLVVRAMIRGSERRVMEYCRELAVRNFEATAAAAKADPSALLEAMDVEAMPDLPH